MTSSWIALFTRRVDWEYTMHKKVFIKYNMKYNARYWNFLNLYKKHHVLNLFTKCLNFNQWVKHSWFCNGCFTHLECGISLSKKVFQMLSLTSVNCLKFIFSLPSLMFHKYNQISIYVTKKTAIVRLITWAKQWSAEYDEKRRKRT